MSDKRDLAANLTTGPRKAFNLTEAAIVVLILGIIAAITIPRMSRGSAAASDSAVARDLALLRNAVDAYQCDHDGRCPAAFGSISVPQLLLEFSDKDGHKVSPAKSADDKIIYGPYIEFIPAISVGVNKGATGIAVSTVSGVLPPAGPGIGWLYNSVDGTFQPYTGQFSTDSSGRLYSSY